MPKYTRRVDTVFRALADPTRRAIVEQLGVGPASTSKIAEPFPMALPSLVQHLGILEESGVVTSTKVGRVRTYRLASDPLGSVRQWLDEQRNVWEERLDRLDAHLETREEPT
jgi:DNA-binding transcriptional ArsR family regulator